MPSEPGGSSARTVATSPTHSAVVTSSANRHAYRFYSIPKRCRVDRSVLPEIDAPRVCGHRRGAALPRSAGSGQKFSIHRGITPPPRATDTTRKLDSPSQTGNRGDFPPKAQETKLSVAAHNTPRFPGLGPRGNQGARNI
jgi:hypothetical protein